MAFSTTLPNPQAFSCFSSFPKTTKSISFRRRICVKAEADSTQKLTETKTQDSSNDKPPPKKPPKPVYSMKKGQIVRVEKEKYLNSINYLSVGHPPYYKGLDYIYEDRGEVSWVGIPTSPAWLPTDMLIKSDKLDYERM
ncbi:NAD(P)H-quinone oxidoreductase subunit O, chloroplastic isoform X2 [Beta vulgaris subsp. vulgaris]|uniref:NAD(P)H-quinone oxidoreductase subunit O, chloroplastic isoform X2 n=1 Tax=Beta vulgaris subsp. vulgaris TaxID=3555 RepID=UPI0020374C01|nr:NAD(P)H-quinone oxidoreductase subunit O, chloroplastic isoform X2 [Beta vulgaris subsp. vulgaris]